MHKDCLSVNSFMRRSLILIFCRRNAPTCSVVISYSFITSSLPFTIILYVVVFLQCTFNLFRSKKVEQRSKLVILSFSLAPSLICMHAHVNIICMFFEWALTAYVEISSPSLTTTITLLLIVNCSMFMVTLTYLSEHASSTDLKKQASKQEKRVR
jgi:hypothetical protein